MQPIQPPKSIYGSLMGSTTVSEESRGVDFGVQQKGDAGDHIYNALINSLEFGVNFMANMTEIENKRQRAILQKQEAAAAEAARNKLKKMQARLDQLEVEVINRAASGLETFPDQSGEGSGVDPKTEKETNEHQEWLGRNRNALGLTGPDWLRSLMFPWRRYNPPQEEIVGPYSYVGNR